MSRADELAAEELAPSTGIASASGEERQFAIAGLMASTNSIRRLRELASARRLVVGESLYWEDDPVKTVSLLTDGTMKTYKLMPNGRTQIIRFGVSGEVLATPLLETHNCTAEALSDCAIVQLPREPLMHLMLEDCVLMHSFGVKLANEMQMAQNQALLLGRMPAVERVSNFLLDFATRQNANSSAFEPGFIIELPMTRADIADYLGLTIETVSRVFSKFRRMGLIDLPRPHLVILKDQGSLRGYGAVVA